LQNPWVALPESADFVLPQDAPFIQTFNRVATPEKCIHLELLPEPYLGNPKARIFLLNLNPGYSEEDVIFHHDNPYFIQTSRDNLLHGHLDYPFYLLDPKNLASSGSHWWMKKLHWLADRYGLETVAHELCVVEYFPYHSRKYGFKQTVPSQHYSFSLVEEAMNNDALIVQMRSKKVWQGTLPRLKNYHNYYVLNSPLAPTISPNNCPEGYAAILKMLG
jgi:hypothetical protein